MSEDEIYEKVVEFVDSLEIVGKDEKDGLIDAINEAIWEHV